MDASKQLVKRMGNQALDTNYPSNYANEPYIDYSGGLAQLAITVHGSDWYWAVCAVMILSTLVFLGLSLTKRREHRIFHYITAAITMVASIAYFSMASGLGWAPILIEYVRPSMGGGALTREIFYVRYIDWAITTPLLLMDLLLTAGLPWPTILFVLIVDEVMIITGLVAALVRSSYKWGYFAFGCAALLYIGYVLMLEARSHASGLGSDIGRVYLMCGAWTFLLWCIYPIAFGVCEGGNLLHPDSEAVFYGILDLCAKPLFGALLLFGHRNIDPVRLGLHIRDYDSDYAVRGSTRHEKGLGNNASNVGNNGYNGAMNNGHTVVTSNGHPVVLNNGTETIV